MLHRAWVFDWHLLGQIWNLEVFLFKRFIIEGGICEEGDLWRTDCSQVQISSFCLLSITCVCVCVYVFKALLKFLKRFNFERNSWLCYKSLNWLQESILKNRKRDKLINVHKIVMSSCSNMLFKVNGMTFNIDFVMLNFVWNIINVYL